MSYSISISGHKDGVDSKEFEESIEATARVFVASLEGVTSAIFNGGTTGQVDLTKEVTDVGS